ncbi:hypothetical protein AVEN_47975-1 [Araneus ventricosus]|uniref:Uncharacterized protein n=1 Tax=Araneus ventricosus TaxID=182803 RepID=A0A4Y2UEM8_ARAVE|nr:hypothetical protein AVEN_47975-1 [Araneus ventricosus]
MRSCRSVSCEADGQQSAGDTQVGRLLHSLRIPTVSAELCSETLAAWTCMWSIIPKTALSGHQFCFHGTVSMSFYFDDAWTTNTLASGVTVILSTLHGILIATDWQDKVPVVQFQ